MWKKWSIIRSSTTSLWTFIFLFAFLGVGFIAIRTTIITKTQQEELRVQNTQEALRQFLEVWEEGVIAQINFWTTSIASESDIHQLESQWRQSTPWLEDIVLWNEQAWIYPPELTAEATAPCLTEPAEWMDCSEENIEVQNLASLTKAQYWLGKGDLERTQFVLLSSTPALRTPIQQLQLSPKGTVQFFQRRFQLLQTETLGGPQNGGQALLQQSLNESNLIHGALIGDLLEHLPVSTIADYPQAIARLNRRKLMWRFIEEYKDRTQSKYELSLSPIIEENHPLLLAHVTKPDGTNIAISLDIPTLMDTLTTQRSGFQPVVLTPNNTVAHPLNPDVGTDWIQVPGPRLFPQYRVALADFPSDDLYFQILITMMPIVLTGVLGFIAIFGAWKADKKKMQLIERQQEFIARVTHELKTPLAGIQLMAESMQMTDHDDIKPFIEKILQESTRLGNRIDEVLQVAKDTEIKQKVRLDTEILLLEIYDIWAPRVHEVGGTIRTEYEACEILADEMLLKDAIQNLLSNALKYKHPKRKLRCSLSILPDGKWLEISVTDNGIGVPISERKRIFERFVRIEGDHRGFAGGHGLGLAFVAETASVHNGWVTCQEGFQGGTKITMRMPITIQD